MSLASRLAVALLLSMAGASLAAQRLPVLKQIDLPHSYYYREMYLPQLTSGPSAAAWSPDSKTLVYSMAGYLWLQDVSSPVARQLTSGPGYDYQPDWSPDGQWVVYSSYNHDAIELWAMDLASRRSHALTREGAVNLEPRFSPDGKRLAFVSTSYNRRFHIFTADFAGGELRNVQRLTGETRSTLPRYYYSAFDHELSPAWSADGTEIVFVSNRGHIYGTGGFWRMKAQPGAEPREIHYEETAWKARPDISPDGHRIVYASYLGQAWHQLWVIPSEGGDAFPISYGDFDNVNPRWSHDGRSIAFISNRGGNTSLWIETFPGGGQTQVVARERQCLKPTARLSLRIRDAAGNPIPARLFVTGEDGRAYAPDDAWIHADDNFDRSQSAFEPHYFHTSGEAVLTVPPGRVRIGAMRGIDYGYQTQEVTVSPSQQATVTFTLRPVPVPAASASHWVSGDVHVHMNYGGTYRDTPELLVHQAAAENVAIVQDLVVNKEQRIPDIASFSTLPDPASTRATLLLHGQEFHTSYWGHLGLLNLTQHYLLPDYSAYPGTAAASLVPSNAGVADMAHEQQAVVGYVHPFDEIPDPVKDASLTNELPVDVALGKVDYIEIVGFSDHKSTADVWYRLLNLGFRLPAAAGTDAMANYASLRGPVGLNRVYVEVPGGTLDIQAWLSALKRGKTFATNGPLLAFTLGGKGPGDELTLPASNSNEIRFTAWMRSIVPVDHLEVVCNGRVAREVTCSADHMSADVSGSITLASGGWCVLRAASEQAKYPVLDLYPYATTSPVYLQMPGPVPDRSKDAAYFMAWIDRLQQAALQHKDWISAGEKQGVLDLLSSARRVYEKLSH